MGFKSLRVHMPCDLSVLSDLTVLSFDFDHEREHTIPYHKYFLSLISFQSWLIFWEDTKIIPFGFAVLC